MNGYGYNQGKFNSQRQNMKENNPSQQTINWNELKLYIQEGEEKIINSELFTKKADEIARIFNNVNTKLNKPSQIRKFYDELFRIKTLIKNLNDYKKYYPYIAMVLPKVAYSRGRELISEEFYKFMKWGIENSKNLEDFEVFMNFFEAIIAYYAKYRKN